MSGDVKVFSRAVEVSVSNYVGTVVFPLYIYVYLYDTCVCVGEVGNITAINW